MSSRREVLIRILALLQRKTLIEAKNRTLKCLKRHYSTVRSVKNVAVLTEEWAFAVFFRPRPGDLTAQESPPPGICHPREKKCQCPEFSPGGGGGWGARRRWNRRMHKYYFNLYEFLKRRIQELKGKLENRCFCWYLAAILVSLKGTPTWASEKAGNRNPEKERE